MKLDLHSEGSASENLQIGKEHVAVIAISSKICQTPRERLP